MFSWLQMGFHFCFFQSRDALSFNPHASNSGLWRSVTGRGFSPIGPVTGCAPRHEARHSPRLRLAPPCSQPRPRPGVAELGVVRRLRTSLVERTLMDTRPLAHIVSEDCPVSCGYPVVLARSRADGRLLAWCF